MLSTLRIKNLALVSDLTLELQPGLNIITGETGAGKSILIGALNLVLGQRADRTLIRTGSDSCSVEAVFDISRLAAPIGEFLEQNGLETCEENQLILKRTFTAGGTNRQFINGSPTTLNALAAIGESLVDIHGPHDHQSLLHPGPQLNILDAFGGLQNLRKGFAEMVRRRSALEAEKAALIVDEQTYAQQMDLLRFQANEIGAARLKANEEEPLKEEYQRASNAAKLLELCTTAQASLSESDDSVLTQAGILGRTLQELQRIDPGARNLVEIQEQAVSVLNDLRSELSSYAEHLDIDPARLEELEERMNLIHSLKRKYGATLEEVIAFGEEAARKLKNLEQRDTEVARLNAELQKVNEELWRVGKELSTSRRKLVSQLGKAVVKQLAALGFKQSQFEVAISTLTRANNDAQQVPLTGLDTVEFQFAPNPGEPARPLRAIASSGELARVMLALKTVLAAEDQIPVLIFDEVDANVGGETAKAVGDKMRQIAQKRQVLCITHLPQVAACGTAHFMVTKQVKGGRTYSELTLLGKPERITELSRMLGGQTDAARKHAEELLKSV